MPPKGFAEGRNSEDKSEIEGKEYEFNLGLHRIDTLAEIIEVCSKKYRRAIAKRDEESVRDYQAMVNTLYTETFIYMEEETDYKHKGVKQDKSEVLNKVLDDFESTLSTEDEVMKKLKEIREVYLSIRNMLQAVGIDIPEQEKVETTRVFSGGG